MRLKYYKLTLRQMSLKKPFVFLSSLILILAIVVYIFNKSIQPTVKMLCESNARSIALTCTNNAVYDNIKDVEYNSLVVLEKDEKNKVTAITAKSMEVNKLSSTISRGIQGQLEQHKESEIVLPIGIFFGSSLAGGYGPKINVKTVPSGSVNVRFMSDFEKAGINQIRHRIYLQITTKVKIVAPFYVDTQEYVNDVTIAETIIVGDTPTSYYNINGVEGINQNDVLNIDGKGN